MTEKRLPSESEVGANLIPPHPRGVGGQGGRGGKPAGSSGQGSGSSQRGEVSGEQSAGSSQRVAASRASRASGRSEGEQRKSERGNVQQAKAKSNHAKRLMAGAGWGVKAPPKCKAVRASQCKGGCEPLRVCWRLLEGRGSPQPERKAHYRQ